MVNSDAVVLNRIREGESDAFALLFERYHDRCARLAMRLLGDPDDAADAVQDAFIRAFLSLDSYEERDRFGSWLLCIVANRCRTAADATRRRASIADEWVRTHVEAEHASTQCETDPALARRLTDALDSLPEATRSVVLRKYSDGLSYEQISADTGVEISALKMRVARGSAQLRRTLASAGITLATIAIIFASHSRDTRKPQTATVIACDTLRAIMRDTLGAATRDSMLPADRCGGNLHVVTRERRHRGAIEPPQKTEF
ncbi:MAG TPA: RNA polymerase sigma factor [Gemmatimonadaceae bacterium]|jgi:RNA polymerase sigma-70 factor (ECF subfamily)